MLGWLHAVPEKEEEPRSAKEPDTWPLPDCGAFSYLAEWYSELRLDFGYTDIKAWADVTGTMLEPWESITLIAMASVYRSGVIKYRDKRYNLRPPYDGRTEEQKAATVDRRMKDFFGD